jgi:hypothetical protein
MGANQEVRLAEHPPNPSDPRPTIDDLIDRADRDALGRLTKDNDALRRQVDAQDRIDASLRRIFAEPDVSITLPGARRPAWLRWAPLAAAAVVLLAAVLGWRAWSVANRPDILGPLYHQMVDAGFKPNEVCTTDEEFARWTRQYLRESLAPTSHPEGLEYVGWSTGRALGNISAILLAKVEGQPVIVVMERTDRVKTYPGALKDTRLHLYRKKVGDVVMYEVTPIGRETILPVIQAQPGR